MLEDIILDSAEVIVISSISFIGENVMRKKEFSEKSIKNFKFITINGLNIYVGYKTIKYLADIFKEFNLGELL